MQLLFAHDHRFFRGDAGELYTLGSFPASFWDRYLNHFDRVQVLARDGGPLPKGADLSRADRGSVSFDLLPSLSSLRQLVFRSPDLDERMRLAVKASDAVVARLPSEVGLLAVKYARTLGKPYAVEMVGCAWDGYFNNGPISARLYAALAFLRARRAIAEAPQVLYVTSRWLQKRYPTRGRSESASNVALLPLTPKAKRARELRLRAIAGGEPPVLGTIGTIRVKGIQTALEALAKLRASGLDLTYRILGPGPIEPWQRLAAKLGIADLVHFDGTRSAGEGVCSWLDNIDVYLQPSFTEGIPRGMIEAMSRGAACIGSTCGGIPEVIAPDRLHRPGDSGRLAEIIRTVVTTPGAVADVSEADRLTATRFDPAKLQARRDKFYSELQAKAEGEGGPEISRKRPRAKERQRKRASRRPR